MDNSVLGIENETVLYRSWREKRGLDVSLCIAAHQVQSNVLTKVQRIHPHRRFSVPVVDLEQLPERQRQTEAARCTCEMARKPFDLHQGPLFRLMLLRHNPRQHTILLTMHHIISDGWSLGIFYRELLSLYQAFRRGEGSPLPALAVQYADFSLWQESWFRGEVYETQLSYWKDKLAGLEPVLALPLMTPWASMTEALQFARAAAPRQGPVAS